MTSVSIPHPCHESWQNMTTVSGGRYCQSCCKTVTDFAAMSNEQIIAYISSHRKVCGRFESNQLNDLNLRLSVKNWPLPKTWRIAAVLSGLITFISVEAKAQQKTGQHAVQFNRQPLIAEAASYMISGCVQDMEGNSLPGVTVKINNTSLTTSTDIYGRFSIIVPPEADSVVFTSVGFQTQKAAISSLGKKEFDVYLRESQLFADQFYTTCVVGALVVRRSFLHRVWFSIKKPFRSIF